jgi:hypothetical protein
VRAVPVANPDLARDDAFRLRLTYFVAGAVSRLSGVELPLTSHFVM